MRALVLLCAGLVFAGCATTETLNRSEPEGLARLDRYARGKAATVHLVTGESSRGRIEFVRVDSTAWRPREGRRAVPTSDVVMVMRDPRGRNALTGAGIGAALSAGALLTASQIDPASSIGEGIAWSLLIISPGALMFYPTVIGALAQPKRTWILSDVPPAPAPAP